jgi:hypothetical protein
VTALPSPSSPPPVTLSTTCALGWLAGYQPGTGGFFSVSGAGFYPDTAGGQREAASAQASLNSQYGSQIGGTTPDTGAKVKITNNAGRGVTLNQFTLENDDSQGTMIGGQPAIVTGPGLPRFLAPGESFSLVLDFADMGGQTVSVSDSTYLHASCKVSGWQ